MRISDWSSDVCSSDLRARLDAGQDFSVFGSPAPEPKHSDLILVAISRVDDLKVAEGLDGLGPDRERNILLVDDDAAAHGHAGPDPASPVGYCGPDKGRSGLFVPFFPILPTVGPTDRGTVRALPLHAPARYATKGKD